MVRFGDKPYYSLDYYIKQAFGCKGIKLQLLHILKNTGLASMANW